MKKIIISIILIMGIIKSEVIFSQVREDKKLLDAIEQLCEAMVNPDSVKLSSLISEKLSYGHSGGHIENKKEFIQSLLTGKSDFVNIKFSDQQITLSGKMAIVRHILEADTIDEGKPGTVKLSVLNIWYKEKGLWKLIARQAVKPTH